MKENKMKRLKMRYVKDERWRKGEREKGKKEGCNIQYCR
jgi:hypothetical protein